MYYNVFIFIRYLEKELDGSTVIALGVRSRKLSNVLKGQS
jgi:hypothetical protein